ncbi:IS5 family transposase [Streptomyces sp. NPDC048723]|uniref:IS5 family transposase n=1 Tax=Streptomyces sp. NPDC048723 TaxID=3365589 RepID=UPI00371F6201
MIDLVAGRGELTEAAWEWIEPLLPQVDGRGRPWRDHRQVVNGVLWRLRTGAPWRDLPERYGPWQTVYERFARWEADGTWARLLEHVQVRDTTEGRVEWTVAVDSTIVRAHQHAAGARPKGAPAGEPADHALGRSRGGLTTKIHLAADGRCRPLAFVLTPGQAGDAPASPQVMAAIRVGRPKGRPRTRPAVVLADKAYSSRAIREHLRRRKIKAVIPQPDDQVANRKRLGSKGGRPPAFDREAYKQRNTVERCINKLKQWRGLATRYDKTATVYRAALHLAAIHIWTAR